MNASSLKKELNSHKNPEKIPTYQNFFKTGKDEYGEGDKFLGLTVPLQRKISKKYQDMSLIEIQKVLQSKIHEHRLTALLILVLKYKKTSDQEKKEIIEFYLKNTRYINNWDLVDLSAHYTLGDYILDKDRSVIYKLARSKNLWEKRIAMLTTFAFIYNGEYKDTIAIAEILVNDDHDLIHKAAGWMLREVGKRVSLKEEERFLKKYHKTMPRTMLRYAIERFPEAKRKMYMKKS